MYEGGIGAFGKWAARADWSQIAHAQSTTAVVEELHQNLAKAMDECFTLKHRKKKTSEPVWMTDWLR